MSPVTWLPRRHAARFARQADRLAAALLTVGVLVQVPHHGRASVVVLSSLCAAACATCVAWRRRAPAAAVAVAATTLLGYQLISSDGQMTFEPYVVLLTYYMLGRLMGARRKDRVVAGVLVGYALVVLDRSFAHLHQQSIGNVGSAWLLFAIVPWVGGMVVARRATLARELASTTLRLKDEQDLRAQVLAGEERTRIARDLHDVIAHGVTVMTLQASGARIVLRRDPSAARQALEVVESAGREAMADLRRIMGVLRHDGDDAVRPPPGLAQLVELARVADAAGLSTSVELVGPVRDLSADLELTAYRIVQEALTNAVKHAAPALARVTVSIEPEALDVCVVDDGGRRAQPSTNHSGSRQGLVGMRERVATYGGDVRTGQVAGGGFEVRARLPLRAPAAIDAEAVAPVRAPSSCHRNRVIDIAITAGWLIALEAEALTSPHRRGPLALNVVLVGTAALGLLWRRRYPWVFQLVVSACALPLASGLSSRNYATVFGVFGVLIPSYAVVSWARPRRAAIAMALWAVAVSAQGIALHASSGGLVGPLTAAAVACAAGWVVRSQRELHAALRETSRRLLAERRDRERLVVAGERARIARDLNTLVAREVTAMVIQATVAQRQLTVESVAAIETAGHDVLAQLRRILGVLRHGPAQELRPQPGLDQIHALIEQSRTDGAHVDFRMEGEPGTLLAGVDLATYRILEEVLGYVGPPGDDAMVIELRFADDGLELDVSADEHRTRSWPTPAIRERVALYDGEVRLATGGDRRSQLRVRLPRTQGVFA